MSVYLEHEKHHFFLQLVGTHNNLTISSKNQFFMVIREGLNKDINKIDGNFHKGQ
jgi:hypothetical protein